MIKDDYLWVEKYRPRTVSDCILPEDLKNTFQEFVDNKNVPNLLLSGVAGVGKTTIALAMLNELGCDSIIINGSLSGNIDTLRNEIQRFASSVSLMGGRKYVILDEADYLTGTTQAALRNFMETTSRNCGYILTCNFPNKIIEPLRSRCSVVDFSVNKKNMPALAAQFFKRAAAILTENGVEYDKATVAEVIKKHYPDWRRVLNELQRYSSSGKIDSGILINMSEISIKQLAKFLKEKDFTNVRKWVVENAEADATALYRTLYNNAAEYIEKQSIPSLVLTIAKYQYQESFVADKEINLLACLVEIMVDCVFV